MAAAFNWTPAWDEYDDDSPWPGLKFYDLPNNLPLYEGDRFFDTEERYIVEVTAVKTKVYKGVVGHVGQEGDDNVFFDTDWSPPRDPTTRHHYTDDINFVSVDEFADRIDDGRLVPHRGNGAPRLPP